MSTLNDSDEVAQSAGSPTKAGVMETEDVTEEQPKSPSTSDNVHSKASPVPYISKASSLEHEFRHSLDDLVKLIDVIIEKEYAESQDQGEESEDKEDLRRLHVLSSKVHGSLMAYGISVEMGLRSPLDYSQNTDDASCDQLVTDTTREALRGIGKMLWMKIRSYPSLFQDRVDRSTTSGTSTDDHKSTDNNSSDRIARELDTKAAASGYIRAITARLVLIDYIQTKGLTTPSLIFVQQGAEFDFDESPLEEKASEVGGSVPSACSQELQFGVKCFARSGRALLAHGDDPGAAFTTLCLSVSCWRGMAALSKNMTLRGCNENKARAAKNLDEAFDAFILIPDAASAASVGSGRGGSERKLEAAKLLERDNKDQPTDWSDIGSTENVLSLLQDLEEFILRYCIHVDDESRIYVNEKDAESSNSAAAASFLALTRYLPGLARATYKHGSRFVQNKEYTQAQGALRLSLSATNLCLEHIRRHDSASDGVNSFVSRFSLQEHEMLVVSKECLFVLSHVKRATGEVTEAHKCLDRLEEYIDEQKRLNNELYVSTMKRLKTSANVDKDTGADPAVAGGLGAVEGPKQQDFADIKARAEAAQEKAKHTEAKERSNLAFSRICLDNFSLQRPTREEEAVIDSRLKDLVELSIKVLGTARSRANYQTTESSIGEGDALRLALTAARGIFIRRLLAAAEEGDVHELSKHNPYDILHSVYGDAHPMHTSIVLESSKSIHVAILKAYGKKNPHHRSELLTALDNIGIESADSLIASIVSKTTDDKTDPRNQNTLFPSCDSELEKIIRETQGHFASALSFYRGRGAHELSVKWADFLLRVLHEISSTENVVADVKGIKAISLCSLSDGNEALALKTARDAWEKGPTLTNLAALFHCGVRAEAKASTRTGDALMELRNALHVLKDTSLFEILSVFPILTNSCSENEPNKGGPLLLGIQNLWINYFVKIEVPFGMNDVIFDNCEMQLFYVLRAYLRNIELQWGEWSGSNDFRSLEQSSKSLNGTLGKVMTFIMKLRGGIGGSKRPRTSTDGSVEDSSTHLIGETGSTTSTLVWDQCEIRRILGEHKDCVWIAEGLWNLGINFPRLPIEVSSGIFAKAHDFALLSEEETGLCLTRGHLDCEQSIGTDDEEYFSFVRDEKDRVASDLSSEFSAQCLLLSVSRVVDGRDTIKTGNHDELVAYNNLVRQSLIRILMAERELDADITGHEICDQVAGFVCWLELQCAIFIGNDSFCCRFLLDGGLLSPLSLLESLSSSLESGASGEADSMGDENNVVSVVSTSCTRGSGDQSAKQTLCARSIVSYTFQTSLLTKELKMPQSEKLLLQFCVNEMIHRRASSIEVDGGRVHSLGELQRALVERANRVEDLTSVFDCVDSALKKCTPINSTGEKADAPWYSTSELDWFALESYNRGLNLFAQGDIANANKLVVSALNILPFCGIEVASYGKDMRLLYSKLVDCKVNGKPSPSSPFALPMGLDGSATTF